MTRLKVTAFVLALCLTLALLIPQVADAQVTFPSRGGTGTSVIPTYGQVLLGNSSGTYTPIATSSLGLAADVDAAYPLHFSGGILSLLFGTTTANNWSALQNFNGKATSTQFTSTGSAWLATVAGILGVGTTSPTFGFSPGIVTGLNKNLILSTDRDTDNFRGNIQFFNTTVESKSGLEWYDHEGDSIAWLVAHDTNPLGIPGDHHHIEIETADLTGHKQGRFTVGYDCDYDCLATFNQTEVQINRNSGQTNGNLLLNGGGQIRNTGPMQIVPNNAINTKALRIATSTDNDIAIDVTSGTELEVLDLLRVSYASTTALSASTLCLSSDCRTSWPSAGSQASVATSSGETSGYVPFWTSTGATPATLSGGESTFAYDSSLNRLTASFASTTALSIGSDFLSDVNGTGLALSAPGVLSATLGTTVGHNEFVGQPYTTGNLFYAAASNAIEDVATSSVTVNAPLTSAGTPGSVVGGSGWTLDIDDIGAADLASADFGSFTCNGTTCSVDSGAISNAMLANSSVSYGGVSLSLGGSDATPAFDLADASNLPIANTTGTLAVNRGGTNIASPTANTVLGVNAAGTGYYSFATSSLNIGGTAALATALAANGSNCTSGQAPLGVDASGAAESCFDVWTEAENTAAGYLSTSAAAAAYQPLDSDLTTIAGLTATTNNFLVSVGSAWASRTPAQARTTLGLVIGTDVQAYDGDLTTYAGITPSANVQSLLGAADYSAMRTLLGLVIGTNVQAYDADITTWGGITPGTGVGTFLATPSSANLATALTGETGSGGVVFDTSPSIASPTLSSFFGTPCTGNDFLQDISDTGAFTCVTASGGGGGGTPHVFATTSPFSGSELSYPINTASDVAFGSNSTTTAPFHWDVSATTTYIGNGGTYDSALTLGPALNEWTMGYDVTDKSFAISSSTILGTNSALSINKSLAITAHGALSVTGQTTLATSLTGVLKAASGVVSAGADGTDFTLVNAVSCTNQFMTALTAAGVGTCGSINNAQWSGTDLSVANGGTGLSTFGGTNHLLYTTAADTLASEAAFTYAASTNLLTVDSATTTNVTISSFFQMPNSTSQSPTLAGACGFDTTSGQLKCGNGSATKVIGNGNQYPAFSYATSTAWTGTTTIPLGPSFVAETWNAVQCFTDTGTVQVSFTDGTNRMNWMNASTTVGTVTLSTNNTFTAAEKRYVEVGTPASTPTKISCTVSKSLTAD